MSTGSSVPCMQLGQVYLLTPARDSVKAVKGGKVHIITENLLFPSAVMLRLSSEAYCALVHVPWYNAAHVVAAAGARPSRAHLGAA